MVGYSKKKLDTKMNEGCSGTVVMARRDNFNRDGSTVSSSSDAQVVNFGFHNISEDTHTPRMTLAGLPKVRNEEAISQPDTT